MSCILEHPSERLTIHKRVPRRAGHPSCGFHSTTNNHKFLIDYVSLHGHLGSVPLKLTTVSEMAPVPIPRPPVNMFLTRSIVKDAHSEVAS